MADKLNTGLGGFLSCGCQIVLGGHGIQYCPKHAAAPEMYEALKALLDGTASPRDAVIMAQMALAKAEGK